MVKARGGPAMSSELLWPPIVMGLLAILLWAVPFLGFAPHDFGAWVGPWYQHILAEGPVRAFAQPFSNYTPPYLYMLSAATLLDGFLHPLVAIKLLSCVGAAWVAYAVFEVLKSTGASDPAKAAMWSLLLPTIVFNVPLLAQADAFWVAPCLLAVAAAVRGNRLRMTIWAGVAFAFKAQAVFIAPFVVAVLLQKRAPLWYWVVPILLYSAAMFPAWLAGWPASDLLTIYYRQATWAPPGELAYIGNAANGWLVFKLAAPDIAVQQFWIGYLLAGSAILLYLLAFVRRSFDATRLIAAATLSSTLLPWLLPGMHERFFALAEILAFCLAWQARSPASIAIAALMQASAILSIGGWLIGHEEAGAVAAILTAAATFMLARMVADVLPDPPLRQSRVDQEATAAVGPQAPRG